MRFENVCIESLAVALPEEVWTSAAIEERLSPLYERLKLSAGRLELMSGIRERRVWPAGTRASDASAAAGGAVLAKSALSSSDVELFIHAAVSRDMLEPATASFAHRKIECLSRLLECAHDCRWIDRERANKLCDGCRRGKWTTAGGANTADTGGEAAHAQ